MLESLVASILNRFLKNYVSNLNYDQLKIGMWKGEVNLRNLKLRKEALDKLKLPIDVSEGHLGEITLVIPWSNLRNEPVKVIIDHVYLLAEPKNEATISLEEEEARAQYLKMRRLSTAEMLEFSKTKSSAEQEELNNKDGNGFVAQLTTKIVDNLQFTMKNVHLRYEDKISDPSAPFAAGITLKELSALSTDESWTPKFINESVNIIHKVDATLQYHIPILLLIEVQLATLESLSVYWNTNADSLSGMQPDEAARIFTEMIPSTDNQVKEHQYILKPVSGKTKIKLNKVYGDNIPKFDIVMLFDELAFCLDNHQYRDAVLMVDLFHANLKKQKYLKFHPGTGKTPMSYPKEYFQYAGKAILSEIHEKKYKWSWDHFKTRRDQRYKYIECYVADRMQQATSDQLEALAQLERVLSFEDIRFYRSIAKTKLRQAKIKTHIEKEKNKAEKAKNSWWGWLTGTSTEKHNVEHINNTDDLGSMTMTEEQRKELFNAIGYDEDKAQIAAAVDVPANTVKFALKAKLKRGSFTLTHNVKEKTETELIGLVFDVVSLDVVQYVKSMKVAATLGDLKMYDGATKGTLYPQLIGVNKGESLLDVKTIAKQSLKKQFDETRNNEPFLSMVFEKKPLNKTADNAFTLRMKHVEIIYSPVIISSMMDFFKPPASRMESVHALIAVANSTLQELRLQTLAGLEYALETHTTFDLNVDMDAPIIIIPENLTTQNSAVVILDTGHISVDSQLADIEVLKSIRNKHIQQFTEKDTATLESLMYDKFTLQLSQTKVLVAANTKDCLWSLQNDTKPRVDVHLIERVDMIFLVELCILPGKTEFTKFKISGHLPLLTVNISDSKYKTFMKILNFVIPKTEGEEDGSIANNVDSIEPPYVANANLINERFWQSRTDTPLLVDYDSDIENETADLSTAASSTTYGVKSSDVKQFQLTFHVDEVCVLINETSIHKPLNDTTLCRLLFEDFELIVVTRANDLSVNASLKALMVQDELSHDQNFKYLVTSAPTNGANCMSESDNHNLINVQYRKVSKAHPEFDALYEGIEQSVVTTLSTLTVVLRSKSILRLYNWIMNTFTSPPDSTIEQTNDNLAEEKLCDHEEAKLYPNTQSSIFLRKDTGSSASVITSTSSNDGRMKVMIHMDGVSLIFIKGGKRIGTTTLSTGDLSIKMEPSGMEVKGKFSNLTVKDDTATENNSVWQGYQNFSSSEPYLLRLVGDDLANFTYTTYDPDSENFPGYNQGFRLRIGAIHLLVTDSLKSILDFLQEFLTMKSVYDTARTAAVERVQQYQGGNRFHFDVLVNSPVLIFPVNDTAKKGAIIVNLGEIRASNKFASIQRSDLFNSAKPVLIPAILIDCGLYDISLRSITTSRNGNSNDTLPIVDDLDIVCKIETLESATDSLGPSTQIEADISDILLSFNEVQYKHLWQTWTFIQQTFLTSEPKENSNQMQYVDNDDTTYANTVSNGSCQSDSLKTESAMPANPTRQDESTNKITLDLIMRLNTVNMQIILTESFDTLTRNECMLSKLAFNGIQMKLQNTSNNFMAMEVSMQSISFADTRTESRSKFKDVLPAIQLDGPQFQFRMNSCKLNDATLMDMKATVDSPRVILSLDYLLLLKNFFISPFAEPTEAQKYARIHSQDSKNEPSKQIEKAAPSMTTTNFKLNVVDLEVICLANPDNVATEAAIFSFKQLTIDQDSKLEMHMDGIGIVLCRMDSRKESEMQLVKEFSVLFRMESASANSIHNLTTIELNVQPIILRLSYQDAMLISHIASKVTALVGSTSSNPATSRTPDSRERLTLTNTQLSDENNMFLSASNQPRNANRRTSVTGHIEPFIVMSKETLLASFDGIQITLIEDLHELPFIDAQIHPFVLRASDWSRAVEADVDFHIKVDSFNFKNSHWEPVIEPWSFCIKVSQDATNKSTYVNITSQELLLFTITHSFVSSCLSISQTLNDLKPLAESSPGQIKHYLFKNCTGYDMRFWNMSDDVAKGDNKIFQLKQGQSQPWTFRDWRKRRERSSIGKNLLGVQIEESYWESILHIPLDNEGERAYRLQPSINGVYHRLIVDIRLENHIKTVVFRSGLVLMNKTSESMQIAMVNSKRRIISDIVHLRPNDAFNVPVKLSYGYWFVVRPSEGFHWSKEMLMWSDVLLPSSPRCIECILSEDNEHSKSRNYQINVDYDKKNSLVKQYPFLKIQFCPPIEIENLLPFDLNVILSDRVSGKTLFQNIKQGNTAHVHEFKSDTVLAIKLDLKSDRYNCSDTAIIETNPGFSAMNEKIQVISSDNVPLSLRMNIIRLTNTSDALHINVYAPYLILNKSGLPVFLRQRQHHYRQGRTSFLSIEAYNEGDVIEPVVFSYPEIDHKNRAQISFEGSKWSEPISFEAVGSNQEVTVLSKADKHLIHAGINIEEGVGSLRLTKIVTITPRFMVKNNMNVALKFCEFGGDDDCKLAPGQKAAFYQTYKSNVCWLCLQLQESVNKWSSPFSIRNIGKTYVKVGRGDDLIPYLVQVSTQIQDSTIFVTFNEAEKWPFYIENRSSIAIRFKQESIGLDEYNLKERQKKAFREPKTFTVPQNGRFKYSWDVPVAKQKRLGLFVGDRHRRINFEAIGPQIPFRYSKNRDTPAEACSLSIDIVAEDTALVLCLTDFDSSKSLYQPRSLRAPSLSSSSQEGSVRDTFETLHLEHVINFSVEVNFAGLGLSIVNRKYQEISYATVKGFDLKYTDSNLYQSIRLGLRWLQIDNQLYSSTYPIILYPTTLPKVASELSAHPTLHIALDKVKDERHGVYYFKLFSLLLQEITIEIDEDFLYAILDFADLSNRENGGTSTDSNGLFVMAITEPQIVSVETLYYFEEFCIQPMRLNLSFVKTDRIVETDTVRTSAVGYIFNVLTMTLGNVNDAPIELNALIVENLRASSTDLSNRIYLHYRDQVIYQVHRVIGSVDLFGNPVGLFNTLSSGFKELFYEPYQGFIMSDRPQDIGIGLAKGVGGFMKKSVFGITDSMSRFTGSLGKGVSAATMDKGFQDRRRINMIRNKPTHALYGVTQGVGYFGTSIVSGFTGLVKRPIEGAEEDGVVGLISGIGKGVVGVFTKPMVGLLDMASNITAGIRETTTVFENTNLQRERIPRYTGKDGIVTPYSQREALGQMWLMEMESGKYSNEIYIAHSLMGDSDENAAILTLTRIYAINTDNMRVLFSVLLNDVKYAKSEVDGVYLHMKTPGYKKLSLREETSREWFASIIQQTLNFNLEESRRQ
ncbi:hypothetical protein BDF20DRAFT_917267 [Mycotypha africana]|uniref:uncharacterized protein n=1 Tax=Mycotypha africana TaxID=64632 RepID=UPI002300AA73|nr:uncharacterized protein BDF20DRAFT_917267 [Mycotypha africana]KAI8968041.1 hypothetical protein BDF20DRAFT_917267 [Mycotypha africana]